MLALSMPMLVVSFVPAAASSLIRYVQEANSANVLHCFRFSCFASCAGEQCKTTTRPKRNVRGTHDDNAFLYRTFFFARPYSHKLCPTPGSRDHSDSTPCDLFVFSSGGRWSLRSSTWANKIQFAAGCGEWSAWDGGRLFS